MDFPNCYFDDLVTDYAEYGSIEFASLPTKPNELLRFKNFGKLYGVKIGNAIYTLTKDYNLKFIAKEFEGNYIPCTPSDSIVSFIEDGDQYEIRYANGDWFRYQKSYGPIKGQLHRGDNIVKFDTTDSDGWGRIKYPNGSVFVGSITFGTPNPTNALLPDHNYLGLSMENWLPDDGDLRFPDGRSIAYRGGETEAERNAKAEAAEAAEAAENKSIYNTLCKRYGKKYVDAVINGDIIIGMPEELMVAVFKPKLESFDSNSKCYYIYGWGGIDGKYQTTLTNRKLNKVVWVTNGKVTSVKNR